MKKELITHLDPKSPISEIFKTLRTNIQFMNAKGRLKKLLITSTLPGEGKSWVSSNLAVTFAQAGKRVLLIDADMRKGRQYTIFGIAPKPGLSNYLSGVDVNAELNAPEDLLNYIQQSDVDNLYIMTAGNVPPNPSELLMSAQMTGLLEQVEEVFDIVIIDGTPCQLVTDSFILSRLVDSCIVVTQSKQIKKNDLKRVITNIQNVGGKILGVVVNKIPVYAKKYEEAYYYASTSRNTSAASKLQSAFEDVHKKTSSQKGKKEMDTLSNEIKPDVQTKNPEGVSLEKTNDILKQINEYIDNEKKRIK